MVVRVAPDVIETKKTVVLSCIELHPTQRCWQATLRPRTGEAKTIEARVREESGGS